MNSILNLSIWRSWDFVNARALTKVSIDEHGFRSCDAGHGLQVAVMPAVPLHVVVGHERFARLCQPDHPDKLHFTFHLHVRLLIRKNNAAQQYQWRTDKLNTSYNELCYCKHNCYKKEIKKGCNILHGNLLFSIYLLSYILLSEYNIYCEGMQCGLKKLFSTCKIIIPILNFWRAAHLSLHPGLWSDLLPRDKPPVHQDRDSGSRVGKDQWGRDAGHGNQSDATCLYPRSVQWNGVTTLAPLSPLDDRVPASLASLCGSTMERGRM